MFYVYDLGTGGLLATSGQFTYDGLTMRGIPGTDSFITVESWLSIFSVGADHAVTSVASSISNSNVSASTIFAFDGAPPRHLVTQSGDLLALGSACPTQPGTTTSTCLAKDGQLGTLRTGESFMAMTNDAAGQVFGLVSSAQVTAFDLRCAGGCAVQTIDPVARLIVSQKSYPLGDLSAVRGLAIDARCGQLIVAYALASPSGSSFDRPAGYRIAALAY
jgi:hypothetical protein